jgi:hypothetical protein
MSKTHQMYGKTALYYYLKWLEATSRTVTAETAMRDTGIRAGSFYAYLGELRTTNEKLTGQIVLERNHREPRD